ncbi:MAG TPA: cytochrome b/b6 domain-containing protein [Gammaproteobacteria bacterium]|nr:cytochrome b/b6 domain-containing protein [Gammaproteobacteria bacterium]
MEHNEVRVWDPFVRIFHWSLVLTFTVSYVTAEELETLHNYAGYAVLGLVLLRIVWGFIGTRHARFRDFVYPPAEVRGFLQDTLGRRAKRYLGHNPAGGAMIIIMLVSLIMTTVTGIACYGIADGAGPLGMLAGSTEGAKELLEEVHEFFANLTVLLVVIHIAGVILESRLHGEHLVRAMFTGRKRA